MRAALGSNKAEALARVVPGDGLAVQAIAEYLTRPTSARSSARETSSSSRSTTTGRGRSSIGTSPTLDDVTLISGGNDETDGNVQLVRRRDGWSVDGHLAEIHPEIGMAS